MVATKENSLEKDTLSSSLSGTLRMWSSTGRHSTNLVSLNVSPLNFFIYLFLVCFLRKKMKWDDVRDGILVKEMLYFEPWNHKHGCEEKWSVG